MAPGRTQASLAQAQAQARAFARIDRRLALSFGLLVLGLMAVVLLVGGWYLRGVMERENERLAHITTQVVAQAVSRVSFAGKYQAQLLLDEVKQGQPDLAYLRLLDAQGHVIAHSGDLAQDAAVTTAAAAYIAPLLEGRTTLLTRRLQRAGGVDILEFSAAYRGGYDYGVLGVLQIGVWDTAHVQALRSGVAYMAALLAVLLTLGMLVIWWLSRRFGAPVRGLATDMARERERLQSTLQAIEAGTWEWDVKSGAVRLDERWAGILGYSLSELQPISSETYGRFCHPEDLQRSREQIAELFAGRQAAYACEARMRHKNGHWVWVLDSGAIVERDAEGKPLRVMGARQDISRRKLTEEAFRQESARFLTLARVSNTGVWEWDQRHDHLWCSDEYFTMLGWNPQDFRHGDVPNLEHAWGALLHPDDRQAAEQRFADYLAAGGQGMYESEFRLRDAHGGWVWIWSRGSALRDAAGRPTGKVVGTHINISSIKEAQARLRESRRQLQHISDSLPDSMIYQLDCGLDGDLRRMAFISEGVQRLHGLSVEQVLADPQPLFEQTLEPDRAALIAYERECIAAMKVFRMEFRARLPDGRERWFWIVSSPRRRDDGHILFDGVEIDITERKQREEEIRRLNAELEQRVQERTAELRATLVHLQQTQAELLQSEKLAALGALVAGVAHELNTPIGNAVTVASTLVNTHRAFRERTERGLTRSALAAYLDDVQEGGQIIERNLQRAAELIGSFKQLAVDQTSAQRRPFELHELVQEIALAMRPTLRKTPITLHADIAAGWAFDSYPGPLGQVLMNLIGNALTHAFEGRSEGSIVLAAEPAEPGWLRLIVSDDGCGIAPELQKKVFDPFFTTRLGQGGSGLGLHIVYTLVGGVLGGRIELQSEPGRGSRFVLHLPLKAPLRS